MKKEIVYDLSDDRWVTNVKQIGETTKNVILTFDDGPSRQLDNMLDILDKKKVPAIFFWQSRLLNSSRPWKRVLDGGHKIGTHAHNHTNLTNLSFDEQYRQVKTSINIIEKVTGQKVEYFRPPFGQYNEDTIAILKELQLVPTMWEISSYDWDNKKNPEKIVSNVVDNIIDGSIILLHELKQTAEVLEQLIDEVRQKGFEFTLIK